MYKRAYSLITGVLLLCSVMLLSLLSIALLQNQTGNAERSGRFYNELAAYSDSCLEEAIIRLKYDSAFTAASLSDMWNSCTITAAFVSGNNYTININGINNVGQILKLRVDVARVTVDSAVNMGITSYTVL